VAHSGTTVVTTVVGTTIAGMIGGVVIIVALITAIGAYATGRTTRAHTATEIDLTTGAAENAIVAVTTTDETSGDTVITVAITAATETNRTTGEPC